jgi:Polyketide synthase modules and related proteins
LDAGTGESASGRSELVCFGGVNAHVVLEEAPVVGKGSGPVWRKARRVCHGNHLFVLSAKSEVSLKELLAKWEYYLKRPGSTTYSLEDICGTLMMGREAFAYRFGTVIKDKEALFKEIKEQLAKGIAMDGVVLPRPVALKLGNIVTLDIDVVMSFYERNAMFHRYFDACKREVASEIGDATISQWLLPSMKDLKKHQDLFHFSVLYALGQVVLELGVRPVLICGEGIGHWVALCVSGMLTLCECIAGIRGKRGLCAFKLKRPQYPFFDQIRESLIQPYLLDEAYLEKLLGGLELDHLVFKAYLEKARLLCGTQFTFRKYLEAWNPYLKGAYHDVYTLIRDEKWAKIERLEAEHERKLLFVITADCLRRLSQKWDLSDSWGMKIVI